jgi:hypothetical protein
MPNIQKLNVIQVVLAGHSGKTEEHDNLILWIAASSQKQALDSLGIYRSLVTDASLCADLSPGDPGVDFDATVENSAELSKASIESKYEAVIGEMMELIDPVETSSYLFAFEGVFEKLKVVNDKCYLSISDAEDDHFDVDADEIKKDS